MVWDDYLIDVLSGNWVAQNDTDLRHGYHLPQTLMPHIPLTKEDAVEKYRISPEYSIESKKDDGLYTDSDFIRHVMAGFVEGELRPISENMMIPLFTDDTLNRCNDVYIGIDWGGMGKTIVWVWQKVDDTFQVLHIEKIETGEIDKQYEICVNLIDEYEAKKIVVDAGGGISQVQRLQKRYGNRVIRNSYLSRPEKPLPTKSEEKTLRSEGRYTIDRTFAIDRIIDLVKKQKIAIPTKYKWIIPQFTAVQGEQVKLKSTGQMYTRYFHSVAEPDDAMHAALYSFIAYDVTQGRDWSWVCG